MKSLIRKHKRRFLLLIIVIVAASASNIYAGFLLSSYYEIITSKNIKKALISAITLLSFWIISVILEYISSCYKASLIKICNIDLRDTVLSSISNLDYDEFIKREPGEYVSWMVSDINQIEKNAITPLFDMLTAISMAVFSIIALGYISPFILAISIVSSGVLSFIPRIFTPKLEKITKALSKQNELFSQKVYNLLSGLEVFLLGNAKKKLSEKLKGAYTSLECEKERYSIKSSTMVMFNDIIFRLFELSICSATALLAFYKIVNIGAVFAVSNISNRFLNAIDMLLMNITFVKSSKPLFDKFKLSTSNKLRKLCPPIQEGIHICNLTIQYGDKVVLKDKNYEFQKGKKYAVIGESGCGKTSLIRTILGLNQQYSGKVLFDGKDVSEYNIDSILENFAYVSQNVYIFNDTIKFNLTLGNQFSDADLNNAVSKVNLNDFVEQKGLDSVIDDQSISGGQKQRLTIARALLQRKKFFIIDEGTSALDRKNADLVENYLLNDKELTVIFITHHMENSDQFDAIYRI